MCIVFSCLPLWHALWWVDSSCAPGRWWQVHLPFLYTDMEAISVLTFAHSPLTSTSSDKVQAFLVSSFAHVRPKYIDRSILLLRTSQLNRTSEPSRKKKNNNSLCQNDSSNFINNLNNFRLLGLYFEILYLMKTCCILVRLILLA